MQLLDLSTFQMGKGQGKPQHLSRSLCCPRVCFSSLAEMMGTSGCAPDLG